MTETKYYYTSDQINSTRIITDSSGSVVYSAVFDPYGGMQKQWVNTYQPALNFSGKERESKSEMDYFGARYYDHLKYRFISVDPVINKDEALVNPQMWNLYSFCKNNPVTYLDPDGRWSETIHNKIIDAAFPGKKYDNIRRIFKEASAYVDSNQNQSMEKSYMHAMSAPWQTPAGAENQMGKFLSDMKTQYKNFMSKGKKDEAYFALGMAMHALMDSTSPSHAGFQTWGNMELLTPNSSSTNQISFLTEAFIHTSRERDEVFNSTPDYLNRSINLVKGVLNDAK